MTGKCVVTCITSVLADVILKGEERSLGHNPVLVFFQEQCNSAGLHRWYASSEVNVLTFQQWV